MGQLYTCKMYNNENEEVVTHFLVLNPSIT